MILSIASKMGVCGKAYGNSKREGCYQRLPVIGTLSLLHSVALNTVHNQYGLLSVPYAGRPLCFSTVSFHLLTFPHAQLSNYTCYNHVWYQLWKVLVPVNWVDHFYFHILHPISRASKNWLEKMKNGYGSHLRALKREPIQGIWYNSPPPVRVLLLYASIECNSDDDRRFCYSWNQVAENQVYKNATAQKREQTCKN